jgi:hypothetical protein
MNKFVLLIPIALLSACNKRADDPAERRGTSQPESKFGLAPMVNSERADLAANATDSAPGIRVTAAPGVAFNYRYAFRLPNAKIAAVQEEHATACEKLGIDHCRIVGMRYSLIDEENVAATLAFKLDPALARDFGKQGIAAVNKSEGILTDSEITGVDAGATIANADRQSAQLRDDLARIEAKLKQPGLSAEERVDLNQQAETLRSEVRGTADTKTAARESLATTPMEFTYGSGDMIPSFNGRGSLRDAFATSMASFKSMFAVLIVTIGVFLPWVLLGGLGYALFRTLRRRFTKAAPDTPVTVA